MEGGEPVDSAEEKQPDNLRLYTPEVKARKTKREIRRLRKLLAEIPPDKLKAAEGLIQEAAFMRLTLDETRHIIDREGVLENFEQGSQRFIREHPATKVYGTLINRYTVVCKSLADLIPGKPSPKDGDPLAAFLQGGTQPKP